MRRIDKIKNTFTNILLLLVTVIIVLILLEVFFRICLGNNLNYEYKDDLWLLKPDQKGFTYPNNKYATINSDGYRGRIMDPQKETILFLGDSFVFGYAIGDDDTLTENLQREFEERNISYFNIVNGGVPGYGISQMIELYAYKFSKYKPKCVVVSFIESNIFRQSGDEDTYYKRKMVVRKLIRSSSFVAFMKPRLEVLRQLVMDSEEFKEENYDLLLAKDMEELKAFNEKLKAENITLILHPWIYEETQTEFYNKVILYNLITLPNYYAAIFEQYTNNINDLYAEDDHPSEIQTRILAEVMADDLLDYTKEI